jgi:hypothetical protein
MPQPRSADLRAKLRRLQVRSRFRGCRRKSFGHPLFHFIRGDILGMREQHPFVPEWIGE